MVDGPALSTDMSSRITVPLLGNQVACRVCGKRKIHIFFMTLLDLGRRFDQHHTEARIQCLYCERSFPKIHGARCHISKCSDTGQSNEGAYKCESCPMSFGTQKGLSTHERHAHPAVRNQKRRGTDPQSRTWTVEEVTLLNELDETYKDYNYPNIEISKVP